MRRSGLLAILCAVVLATLAEPATALDVTPEQALIGPVRYTETSGAQDAVYGAPLLVIGDAYASNPVTSDDTVVMTLTAYPTANATVWLRKINAVFPAAGSTADDSLTADHPSTTPSRLSSQTWFSLLNGSAVDDTVLKTNLAVNAPGTYSGTIVAYEGSAATMNSASIVQTTQFSFTTAGAPTTMTLSRTTASLIADPSDTQHVFVSVKDAQGRPTQVLTADTIQVASGATSVVTVAPALVTAADFDDTLPSQLGSATVSLVGGSTAGSTTVTLTPQGTLPSSGVKAQSITVSSAALTTAPPSPFTITYPFDQVVKVDTSTDDTFVFNVNDAFITQVLARTVGATPSSGVLAYVSASSSNWQGLKAMDTPDQITDIANGATNVPVILRADSTGQARIVLAWNSVSDGGQVMIRVGSGTNTRWTVINVVDPVLVAKTTPNTRVLAKSGEAIDFTVTLTDNFGNAYPGYTVTGRSYASSGFPVGPLARSSPTDAGGITTLSVVAPDDTYAGNARIPFTVVLPSGLPYTAFVIPQVLVTYSATGNPTSLTVLQGQSTPSPIGPTSVLTAYPHIVVPFTGQARTSDGTPGTWSTATSSGTPNGTMATFTPSVIPATTVKVTASPGVRISTSSSAPWDGGKSEVWIDSGSPVYAFSSKVGTHSLTFTVGSLTTTALVKVSTIPAAAYNIAVTPKEQTLGPGAFGTALVTITDAFGNPVPRTTDDTGGVTVTASGQALLSGFASTATVTTDDTGQAKVAIIAAGATGDATLTATPRAGTTVPAWQVNYKPPTGFAKPVVLVTSLIRVQGPRAPATITIAGDRSSVGGRSVIEVEGMTSNIDRSVTLTPWVKLAGQGDYAQGTAVITPAADGSFMWSRRTGKKAYVYITTADGTVTSNRVIIR